VAILALSALYLLKYTVMHDLLLDLKKVHWETPVGGQISLQTPGIDCGEGCGFNVTQGTAATMQVTPAPGYRFVGWSGGCAGLEPTCTVAVNDDVQVAASFVPSFILRVGASPGGAVEGLPEGSSPCVEGCELVVDAGTVLSFKALAAPRYRFVGWTGDCAGADLVCALTLDANKQVTPRFVPTVAVTLDKTGEGLVKVEATGLTCSAVCSATFDSGVETEVIAEPAPGYRFAGWTGACAGQEARCTVKPDTDVTLGVTFVRTHAVRMGAATGGQVLGAVGSASLPTPGPWLVDEGSVLSLLPVAQPGVRFSRWLSGCEGVGTCELTVSAAMTVEPLFEPLPVFPLTVSVKGVGRVTSAPEGLDCQSGQSVSACKGRFSELTLTAKAGDGYRFRRWVGCASGSSPVCAMTLRRAAVIQAEFAPVPRHEVRLSVSGPGSVQGLPDGRLCAQGRSTCGALVMQGSVLVLTAVPAQGHFFVGWFGACSGRELNCRVPVGGRLGLKALFK
jgi:uncharacterized repeat protein (TIGR02543 family)